MAVEVQQKFSPQPAGWDGSLVCEKQRCDVDLVFVLRQMLHAMPLCKDFTKQLVCACPAVRQLSDGEGIAVQTTGFISRVVQSL